MPKLIYALMCADLIIDKDSNSTSFIRTIEHAVVPKLPAVLPPVFFASLWDIEGNDSEQFTISLNLTSPSGESVILGVQEVTPGSTMLHKMNFQLPGLNVGAEGRHTVSASIKNGDQWEVLAELPLFVFMKASS